MSKKKNSWFVWGWDRTVSRDHSLSTLSKPPDDKRCSSGRIFYLILTLMIDSYSILAVNARSPAGYYISSQSCLCGYSIKDLTSCRYHLASCAVFSSFSINVKSLDDSVFGTGDFWPYHLLWNVCSPSLKIVSESDQEIPQSQTAVNPIASRGRAVLPASH